MLKISYVVCFDLSPGISLQFTLKMWAAAKNCENFTKNYFRGSRLFKVIDVDKSKKSLLSVLVKISSIYVPICNRYHTIRANSGKITWRRCARGTLSPKNMKFCHKKPEFLGQPTMKLVHRFDRAAERDGQTDRRTDRRTPRPRRSILLSRIKSWLTLCPAVYCRLSPTLYGHLFPQISRLPEFVSRTFFLGGGFLEV